MIPRSETVHSDVPLGSFGWRGWGWLEDAGHPTLDYAKQLLEPPFIEHAEIYPQKNGI